MLSAVLKVESGEALLSALPNQERPVEWVIHTGCQVSSGGCFMSCYFIFWGDYGATFIRLTAWRGHELSMCCAFGPMLQEGTQGSLYSGAQQWPCLAAGRLPTFPPECGATGLQGGSKLQLGRDEVPSLTSFSSHQCLHHFVKLIS